MTAETRTPVEPMALFRTYLILAGLAFVLGFAAYLAVGWAVSPRSASAEAWQAPASAPTEPVDLTSIRVA